MQSFMSVNYFVLKIWIFKETLFGPDKLSDPSKQMAIILKSLITFTEATSCLV